MITAVKTTIDFDSRPIVRDPRFDGTSTLEDDRGDDRAAESLKADTCLLNDYRVDTISAESLQETVSLIRDIEIFDGSVDENIRMGRADIGSDDVNLVISGVNLQKTISGLDNGLVTNLSVSGYPLSQGQTIRVVLARALIAKPGVLFIDGLLDRLSDGDTLDVLQRLNSYQNDTTIVISTGRRVIADWADNNLNISMPVWEMAKNTG